MKIELPKNWKEIAGMKDITYQRPPLTDSKLAPGVKPIPPVEKPELQKL
jgi:hypothetical protein